MASFSRSAAVENDDEGPVLYISTWYVDCHAESTSEDSRVARLDVMSNMWVSDIRRLWRDKITHGDPVFFTWVRPTPLAPPLARTSGHLIVYQHATSVFVPVLISFHFLALNLDGVANAVASVDRDASPEHIVQLVNLERVCRGRKCTFTLSHPIQVGEGLKFTVPPPDGRVDFALSTRPNAVALIDTGPPLETEPCFSLLIEDQPEFVQHLYQRWQQESRRSVSHRDHFLEVTTWYLDGEFVPFNDQSRPVLLGSDFHNWIAEIRRVWHDLADAVDEVNFAFVSPTPSSSPLETLHILLLQHVPSTSRGILVTTYDNALGQGRPVTAATVVNQRADRNHILEAAGRSQVLTAPGVHCSVWFGSLEIVGIRFLEPHHGDTVNIHIHRPFLVDWETDEFEAVNLLQTNARPFAAIHSKLGSAAAPPAVDDHFHAPPESLRLDLSQAVQAMEWYDAFFVLPAFYIESQLSGIADWHPASLSWIRTPWYAFDDSVTAVRIYYDGSFMSKTGRCGFAAVAFVLIDQVWHFAGATSGAQDSMSKQGSYQAEVLAANLAVKMLFDICKILFEVFACCPHCELIFDSLTVGRHSEGLWKAQRAVHACHLIRSVLRVCEARFGLFVSHTFQSSHVGEPGNELVDVIARCAAQGLD